MRAYLVLLAVVVVGCGTPFGESASTRGPGLSVTLDVGRAAVSWRPVVGAQSYQFEWSTDPSWATGTTVESATSPQVVEGLVPGKEYWFRVNARLANGPTAWSTDSVKPVSWAWQPPTDVGEPTTRTEVETFNLGNGQTVQFTTEYTETKRQYDRVLYDDRGLTWTTWIETETKMTGSTDSTVAVSNRVSRRGEWTKRWRAFALNELQSGDGVWSALSPETTFTTSFNSDRATLTLDARTWSLQP